MKVDVSGNTSHAMLDFIHRRDLKLMYRMNNWRAPRWIRLWMICATRGGDGWFWYAMIAAVLLFGGTQGVIAAIAAGMAAGIGIALFLWLKRCTGRKRPCAIAAHCWATLLPPDQFSFPSGHSITAFSIAVPIGLFFPPLMPALLFCAFSVAVSRIVLGMHFLSDVLAGSALGALLGFCAYLLYR